MSIDEHQTASKASSHARGSESKDPSRSYELQIVYTPICYCTGDDAICRCKGILANGTQGLCDAQDASFRGAKRTSSASSCAVKKLWKSSELEVSVCS